MAKPKERGVFWVVSTHVVTTGFAFPLLAGILVTILLMQLRLSPWEVIGLSLGVQALAYVGGTYYSLRYLQRTAIIARPMACVTPSIVTFAVLAALSFAFNVFSSRGKTGFDPIQIAIFAAFYTLITILFAVITKRGFAAMHVNQEGIGFPVQNVGKSE